MNSIENNPFKLQQPDEPSPIDPYPVYDPPAEPEPLPEPNPEPLPAPEPSPNPNPEPFPGPPEPIPEYPPDVIF